MTAAADCGPAAPSAEESLLSGLLRVGDPDRVREALAIAAPADFADPLLARVAQAMLDLADRGDPIDATTLHVALSRESSVGSRRAAVRVGELMDCEATGALVSHHARLVRRDALERRERLLAQRLVDPATPGDLRERARRELGQIAAELEGGIDRPRVAPETLGYTGSRLLALLDRPRPAPVEAGRPVPGHLWLLVAPPMTGKTSLAMWGAMARAAGVAPWDGAEPRPAGRVLMVSPDEAPEQVARRMHGLATVHPAGAIARYAERITVIGPDREVDPAALDALRLDDAGLATLGRWLAEADAAGAPYTEVYLDAYADMIPPGDSENSNEAATRIGGALERLAVHYGCAITLLHHSGKPRADAGEEPDVRYLGRGASALAAKARVVSALELVAGMPHLRRLRTATNLGPTPRSVLFEVASPDGPAEELIYWRPAAEQDRQPEDLIAPGERISTRDLARRLAGPGLADDADPPGECRRQAAALRERWRADGRVRVTEGPRRAQMIELVPAHGRQEEPER